MTLINIYKIFINKKNCIMCDWILIELRRTYKIFWLIHYNFFLIFKMCKIICNVFLIILLKSMFMFTFLCRSMTFKTLHMNIKKFKRNENSKSINFTFCDDSMMNMFTKTSFKKINFAQRMNEFKFISIIVLYIVISKNACSSNQSLFFKT